MNIEHNHLVQRTACEGSGKERVWAGEERCWSEAQIKKMEVSGYFEIRRTIRVFGRNFHLSAFEFKSLIVTLICADALASLNIALLVAWWARVR